MKASYIYGALLFSGMLNSALATDFEYSGYIAGQARLYSQEAQFQQQDHRINWSLSSEVELLWQLNDGADELNVTPFYRIDQHDSERTHGDLRELSWIHYNDDWELRVGLRKEFWGVTEFQHLVDVINQTDIVEDIDFEDKLGQQMLNVSVVTDYGIFDAFILPGFREQSFPSVEGRLRASLVVDDSQAGFESSKGDNHIDYALRWGHSISDYDIGLSWFKGTNRTPLLLLDFSQEDITLVPFYEQMTQLGADIQATKGDWLWKGEFIWRDTRTDEFWASQVGAEYTYYGIAGSVADVGLIIEYGWDQRGEQAQALFQNDLSLGTRLAFNDAMSTEVIFGVIYDLDYDSVSVQLESSRRIGEDWKLSIDGRVFSASNASDLMSSFDRDDHLQLTLQRFF